MFRFVLRPPSSVIVRIGQALGITICGDDRRFGESVG